MQVLSKAKHQIANFRGSKFSQTAISNFANSPNARTARRMSKIFVENKALLLRGLETYGKVDGAVILVWWKIWSGGPKFLEYRSGRPSFPENFGLPRENNGPTYITSEFRLLLSCAFDRARLLHYGG